MPTPRLPAAAAARAAVALLPNWVTLFSKTGAVRGGEARRSFAVGVGVGLLIVAVAACAVWGFRRGAAPVVGAPAAAGQRTLAGPQLAVAAEAVAGAPAAAGQSTPPTGPPAVVPAPVVLPRADPATSPMPATHSGSPRLVQKPRIWGWELPSEPSPPGTPARPAPPVSGANPTPGTVAPAVHTEPAPPPEVFLPTIPLPPPAGPIGPLASKGLPALPPGPAAPAPTAPSGTAAANPSPPAPLLPPPAPLPTPPPAPDVAPPGPNGPPGGPPDRPDEVPPPDPAPTRPITARRADPGGPAVPPPAPAPTGWNQMLVPAAGGPGPDDGLYLVTVERVAGRSRAGCGCSCPLCRVCHFFRTRFGRSGGPGEPVVSQVLPAGGTITLPGAPTGTAGAGPAPSPP